MILPGNAQAQGHRAEQQDAFAFSDLSDVGFCAHSGALCVLCDGMGGHAAGGEAARAAVAQFLERYRSRDPAESIARSLERALQAANEAVLDVAARAGDSGSTLVAAVLHQGLLRWISVGDSRLMLLRDGRLHCVNREHRYRSELLRHAADGELPWDEAQADPQGEHLMSSLGESSPAQVDRSLRPLPLRPGDQIYLASDGLYRTVDQAALLEAAWPATARTAATPDAVCAAWVDLALAAALPDQDNVTVAGLGWQPDALPRLSLATSIDPPVVAAARVGSPEVPSATSHGFADTAGDSGFPDTVADHGAMASNTASPPRKARSPVAAVLAGLAAVGLGAAWFGLHGDEGSDPSAPPTLAKPPAPLTPAMDALPSASAAAPSVQHGATANEPPVAAHPSGKAASKRGLAASASGASASASARASPSTAEPRAHANARAADKPASEAARARADADTAATPSAEPAPQPSVAASAASAAP